MAKYFIVPRFDIAMELEAETPEDAMCDFAFNMESDMNTYFRAVDASTYEGVLLEATKLHYLEWAKEKIREDFEDESAVPEEDVADVAESAWDYYCDENGTEYECIELAVAEYAKEKE